MKQVKSVCIGCQWYSNKRGKGDYCVCSNVWSAMSEINRLNGVAGKKEYTIDIDDVPPECQRVLEHLVLGQK